MPARPSASVLRSHSQAAHAQLMLMRASQRRGEKFHSVGGVKSFAVMAATSILLIAAAAGPVATGLAKLQSAGYLGGVS